MAATSGGSHMRRIPKIDRLATVTAMSEARSERRRRGLLQEGTRKGSALASGTIKVALKDHEK